MRFIILHLPIQIFPDVSDAYISLIIISTIDSQNRTLKNITVINCIKTLSKQQRSKISSQLLVTHKQKSMDYLGNQFRQYTQRNYIKKNVFIQKK